MKSVAASCKFCGKILHLQIDDSYSEVADPLKLIPLAACNACADLRVKRRRLLEFLSRDVTELRAAKTEEQRQKCAERLTAHTKGYVRMVSEWTNTPGLAWDEAIVDAIMADPDSCGDVLKRIWPEPEPQGLFQDTGAGAIGL